MLDPELERILAKLNDPELLSATLASIAKSERELMKQLEAQAQWHEIPNASGQWYADRGASPKRKEL
jgi:hypothetical protein